MVVKGLRDVQGIRDYFVINFEVFYGIFIVFIKKMVQFVPELFGIVKVVFEALFVIVGLCVPCFGFALVSKVLVIFPINRVSGCAVFLPGFVSLLV